MVERWSAATGSHTGEMVTGGLVSSTRSCSAVWQMVDIFMRSRQRGIGLVVVAALSFSACSQGGQPRDELTEPMDVTAADLEEPSEYVRLGLTLDESGSVVVVVPDCPGIDVTSIHWAAPEALHTFWSAYRSRPGKNVTEITIGEVPANFVESISIDAELAAEWDSRETLVVVGREGESGASVAAGAAMLKSADLRTGRISYKAGAGSPSFFADADEFWRSASCEPILDE